MLAAATAYFISAPWASARGVFRLRIFDRKGVFLFRVSEMSGFQSSLLCRVGLYGSILAALRVGWYLYHLEGETRLYGRWRWYASEIMPNGANQRPFPLFVRLQALPLCRTKADTLYLQAVISAYQDTYKHVSM